MYIHDPPPLNIDQLSSKLAHVSFSMRGRIPPKNKEKFELLSFIGTLVPVDCLWVVNHHTLLLVLVRSNENLSSPRGPTWFYDPFRLHPPDLRLDELLICAIWTWCRLDLMSTVCRLDLIATGRQSGVRFPNRVGNGRAMVAKLQTVRDGQTLQRESWLICAQAKRHAPGRHQRTDLGEQSVSHQHRNGLVAEC